MKKICMIGEHSFVGNSFQKYLVNNFQDSYIVDIISSRENKWLEVDFSVYDAVFNVAGIAHVKSKENMRPMYYKINRDLPLEIAEKAKKDGCSLFIHMSSMIVYGNMSKMCGSKNITLSTEPSSDNFYGDSKLQADIGLLKKVTDSFHIAIIRPPLIYSENARDNFPRLIKVARTLPVFPDIDNKQSMIYVDNLCELIRLIIVNYDCGVFHPQNKEYTCTSKMVKKFADCLGNRMTLTKFFNPILKLLSHKIGIVNKSFGNLTYDKSMSNYYDYSYCVVGRDESIKRICERIREREAKI